MCCLCQTPSLNYIDYLNLTFLFKKWKSHTIIFHTVLLAKPLFFLPQMSNFYIFFSHKQTNKLSALLSCSCFELLFQWFHLSTNVFVCLSVCFKCEICCIKTKKLFSFTAEGPQKGCAAAKWWRWWDTPPFWSIRLL